MDPPIKKVLVIDDDVNLHDLCRAILTRYGYLCVSAHNGEEGLEKIKKENPDLVLLDLTMPIMGGGEALSKIKEMNPNLPVVISSGYSEDKLERIGDRDKIAAFIQKPYKYDQISKLLNQLLNPTK